MNLDPRQWARILETRPNAPQLQRCVVYSVPQQGLCVLGCYRNLTLKSQRNYQKNMAGVAAGTVGA